MDTLYFSNGHFLSNTHQCRIECRDQQGDKTVVLFSVDAAFNYMNAQFFGECTSVCMQTGSLQVIRLQRQP